MISQKAVEAALDAADYIPNSDNRKWMRAALEAALAVDGLALQGWQPIESAPKDNSAVLLYVPMNTIHFVTTAFWDTVAQEWRVAWTGIQNTPSKVEGATHYMPLPSPPSRTEG